MQSIFWSWVFFTALQFELPWFQLVFGRETIWWWVSSTVRLEWLSPFICRKIPTILSAMLVWFFCSFPYSQDEYRHSFLKKTAAAAVSHPFHHSSRRNFKSNFCRSANALALFDWINVLTNKVLIFYLILPTTDFFDNYKIN